MANKRQCLLSLSESSVVDPNTLNLDPDLGIWPNLDQDSGLCYKFWNFVLKKAWEANIFANKDLIKEQESNGAVRSF